MNILVIGATSDIARAIARRFAELSGCRFTLAARNTAALEADAADLEIRCGGSVALRHLDVSDDTSLQRFLGELDETPDLVVIAAGAMADQNDAQANAALLREMIEVNYTGPAVLLERLAEQMAARGAGSIIGISSVAGDRGRASNYLYGASKAAFTAYLSGLRNRLFPQGVHVLTVLPGFVRTRMTEGMDLPEKLVAEPEQVAKDVFAAWQKKRDVIYTRWFWRLIMLVIRSVPERVFKRMKI